MLVTSASLLRHRPTVGSEEATTMVNSGGARRRRERPRRHARAVTYRPAAWVGNVVRCHCNEANMTADVSLARVSGRLAPRDRACKSLVSLMTLKVGRRRPPAQQRGEVKGPGPVRAGAAGQECFRRRGTDV